MTLKTLTGPSIRAALEDARRLFGPTVVLLQSAPPAGREPASVTVGYDAEATSRPQHALSRPLAVPSSRPTPAPAAPVRPAPAPAAPRAYGYPTRKARPARPEPVAAAPSRPQPRPSAPIAPPEPAATAGDVAALRAQLARLEAELARVRHAPRPRRKPLVLVGSAGSGKTALALRLARRADVLEAACPAVVIVAPDDNLFLDPSSVFWGSGVPVAVVRSAAEVAEALDTFADADALVVDTPAIPSDPARARAAVARLGETLAPLAAVEVVAVVDGARPPAPGSLQASGLRPDALAVTRLDETSRPPGEWAAHLGVPLRFTSSGRDLEDVALASAFAAPAPALEAAPPAHDLEAAPPRPAIADATPRTDLSSLLPDIYADMEERPMPATPVLCTT